MKSTAAQRVARHSFHFVKKVIRRLLICTNSCIIVWNHKIIFFCYTYQQFYLKILNVEAVVHQCLAYRLLVSSRNLFILVKIVSLSVKYEIEQTPKILRKEIINVKIKLLSSFLKYQKSREILSGNNLKNHWMFVSNKLSGCMFLSYQVRV